MISIIIPLYNQSDKIKKCLESIQNQTYNNYEIIIINDRSTDRLSKVIEWSKREFGYKIEWLHNYENHGAPYTRNKGFKRSKGEYVLFCDSDIIMKSEMLKIMLTALKDNKETGFVYSSHYYGYKLFKFWPFDYEKLKQIPYLHSTSLMRREAFPKNGWDEKLKKLQDWDFWLTVVENGYGGLWINKVLFTIQPGGIYSSWLPSFIYKLMPFLSSVKKYKTAVKIIKKKHNL